MSKENLGAKVKELRTRKGFSQEYLSEESTLSLRTIQRIENGESIPTGDTLIKLTKALGVTPDDMFEWTKVEDEGYVKLLNLSALTGIFVHPILGIIVPMAMWVLKKDKVNLVDDYGKKLINFQITWALLLYSTILIATRGTAIPFDFNFVKLLSSIATIDGDREFVYGLFLTLIYLYNLVLISIHLRKINKGIKSNYFPAIPILR